MIEGVTVAHEPKTAPPRGPGRPRSIQAHQAILDAAITLLSEVGFDRLTVEGIAARAGVGKTTIYRRWPDKESLVVEALATMAVPDEPPDTGDVRADLVEIVSRTADRLTNGQLGRLLPRLLGEQLRNPDFAKVVRERFIEPKARNARRIVQRAVERGELRGDTDADLVHAMLVGPIFYEIVPMGRKPSRHFAEALVDAVLEGLRP